MLSDKQSPQDVERLDELQKLAWSITEDKGFHEGDEEKLDSRSRPKILSLIHSEVSEALEADRSNDDEEYAEELADVVIRVLDHAESEGIDLLQEVQDKMETNQDREYKHGREY